VEVLHGGRWYLLRPSLKGTPGKVFGAVGVAVPLPAREVRGAKTDVQVRYFIEKTDFLYHIKGSDIKTRPRAARARRKPMKVR